MLKFLLGAQLFPTLFFYMNPQEINEHIKNKTVIIIKELSLEEKILENR